MSFSFRVIKGEPLLTIGYANFSHVTIVLITKYFFPEVGERLTTAKAYLNKAQGRQNLNIVTKAFVSRVIKMSNKNNLILYINACT
jgi:hypothetical protein